MKRTVPLLAIFLWSAFFAEAAPPELPKDIFECVQVTERIGYYFNKEHIAYGVDEKGIIDFNIVVVPTVKVYDKVQISDVVTKRNWHQLPTEGYNRLSGAADYLRFDLVKKTVTIYLHQDLDDTWTKIGESTVGITKNLTSFKENDVEGKFYRAILSYAADHKNELLSHTKGVLSESLRDD